MEKASFLIYLDYQEQFELLTDEQAGRLIKAIIKYEKQGEIIELDGTTKMAFSFIKAQLDRDREKYQAKCKKNKENGAKGGRPRKNQKDISKTEWLNQKPKKPDKDKEKDKDKENDNKEDTEEILDWEEQFDKFYSKYPKKVKKQDVKRWFMKNKPSSELFSSMMNSLEQFRGCKDWLKDDGQYIPYPSTWLNQKRWEDEGVEEEQSLSSKRQYANLDFLYANKGAETDER